jgi:hypothetical protein
MRTVAWEVNGASSPPTRDERAPEQQVQRGAREHRAGQVVEGPGRVQ